MFGLFNHYFPGVGRQKFMADLDRKDRAVLLETDAGAVCGFTTVQMLDVPYPGGRADVIYSGDTIVDRRHWGTTLLAKTWLGMIDELRLSRPGGEFFWLLVCSGYRTYRFLPVFWRRFFPSCRGSGPDELGQVMHAAASAHFRSQYDPAAGIVKFDEPQVLRSDIAEIAPERMADPDVAFFIARNPGYHRGDELVTITRLSPENQTRVGRRVFPLTVTGGE